MASCFHDNQEEIPAEQRGGAPGNRGDNFQVSGGILQDGTGSRARSDGETFGEARPQTERKAFEAFIPAEKMTLTGIPVLEFPAPVG
jgi:hypothetical protein